MKTRKRKAKTHQRGKSDEEIEVAQKKERKVFAKMKTRKRNKMTRKDLLHRKVVAKMKTRKRKKMTRKDVAQMMKERKVFVKMKTKKRKEAN